MEKLSKKIEQWDPAIEKAEFVFQLLFFVYVCLGFNNLTIGTKIVSVFMWPTYLLGAALFCLQLLDFRAFRPMPGLPALLGLCAVCGVSVLLHRQYDFKGNLVYLIFWIFYFFLLYASPDRRSLAALQKRFAFFFHLFSVVAFVLTIISFVMLAAGYAGYFTVNGEMVRRGFLGGRLFGAYQTPNAGSIIGALVIVGGVHYARTYKNKWYTLWAAVNGLLQFVYAVFADSRSGRVTLGAALGVYFFFALYDRGGLTKKKKAGELRRTAMLLLCAVCIAAGAFFLPKAAERGYNAAARSLQAAQTKNEQEGTEKNTEEKEDDVLILGRTESLEGDYSNRRFDFWKSGLEIFAKRPVLGVTFRGFLPFAEEYLPDTYLVTNDFNRIKTLDNDVINLMVSNGALGLLCFLLFVIPVLLRLFRWIALRKKQGATLPPAFPLLLAFCAGAAASSMFGSGVFYMQCQYSFLFWLALGILMRFCAEPTKEAQGVNAPANAQKEAAADAG